MFVMSSVQAFADQFGGHTYVFPDGTEVWSQAELSDEEWQEQWEWIQSHAAQIEVYSGLIEGPIEPVGNFF